MKPGRMSLRQWAGWIGLTLVLVLVTAVAVWRGDILRASLDPQVPFQTYTPPPAPDYALPTAWALRDARGPDSGPASIFFVHSTTFDGGREWNGPIGDPAADAAMAGEHCQRDGQQQRQRHRCQPDQGAGLDACHAERRTAAVHTERHRTPELDPRRLIRRDRPHTHPIPA